MTTNKLSDFYEPSKPNCIARYYCASKSATVQKIMGVAAVGLFLAGNASLYAAVTYGTITIGQITAIGFA